MNKLKSLEVLDISHTAILSLPGSMMALQWNIVKLDITGLRLVENGLAAHGPEAVAQRLQDECRE